MTATAASYASVVQDLYVTYFGRPADYFGLQNFEKALLAANAPTTLSGLNAAYATNSAVKALVDSFGTSAESVALYGAVTTSSASAAAFVNAIYENLFNRASDVAGLTFWTNAITSGKLTLGDAALSIAAGASAAAGSSAQSATDWQSVQNKVTVAGNFTTTLGDYPASNPNGTAIADYSGADAAASARAFLHTVDGTMTAAAAAALDVTGAIASIVNNAPGNTFTLTTGPDTFVGGTGNNVFNATGLTFTALDNLSGNTTGQNTLNVIDATGNLTTAPTGVTLTNIQTVNITSIAGVGASTMLDLSSATGLATLNVTNTTGNDYLKVGSAVAVTVNNQGNDYIETHGGKTITATTTSDAYVYGGSGTTTVTINNASYTYIDDVNEGSSPYAANSIANVTLNNVSSADIYSDALSTLSITAGATAGSATPTINVYTTATKGTGELDVTISGLTGGTITDGSTKTASLMAATASTVALSVGAATTLDLGGAGALVVSSLTDTAETAVNITGAGGVTVNLSSAAGAVAVDASASTGANTVTLNASASYTGGSGNSTVTETAGVAITGAVNGGTGTNNTLLLSGTIADLTTLTASAMSHFSHFETIGLTGSYGTTAGTLDLAVLPAGIVNVELGGTAGAAITVKDGASSTLSFISSIGQAVTYTEKTVGTNDSLTVNVGAASNTGITDTLTAATVEKLNLSSNATAATVTNTLHGTFAAATTVTITGNAGLSLDAAALTVATKIDGSAMTGELNVTGVLTTGISISAGTGGADINGFADSTHGDTITIGDTGAKAAEAAEVSVVDGNNTITIGNDASSHGEWVYAGNGNNTITMGNNTGTSSSYVSVGNGNNVITIGDMGAKTTGAYVSAGNGNNSITIGANAGVDSSYVSVGSGNNTIHIGANSGTSNDYVYAGNGNNTITTGDFTGTGSTGAYISVGNGNNTITVGAGASAIYTGTGLNSVTLGTGAVDVLHVTAGVNVSTYDTVTGWAKGDSIVTATAITETGMTGATASAAFEAAKITSLDPATATFQQFADYAVHNVATAAGDAAWFVFGGNTYIVENLNGTETTFLNGTDVMVKLVGSVDLTTATIVGGAVVHG